MEATLDPSLAAAASTSTRSVWIGRVLSALPALFLLMDAAMKLAKPQPVLEACARLGLPESAVGTVGVIELTCLALYLVPRTAVLGAVLLTGFLGGAVVLHFRMGDPLVSHTLFPTYVGALFWVGLYLRDPRVRALARASK